MAKDNISLSTGITGMQRTTHSHLEEDKIYTFARNANLETDLESVALTNEHANILCHRFVNTVSNKPQVVVGHKYDHLNQRVWFLLTDKEPHLRPGKFDESGNQIYGRQSEIGYISVNTNYEDEDDLTEACGCDMHSFLTQPLESQVQLPHCRYTTLLNDCEEADFCLNFDPNYPVHGIQLKQEACGFTMTLASKNNPPRYIILDQIEDYKKTGTNSCGDDLRVDICVDCDKLRLFPLHEPFYIEAKGVDYGGNLRSGQYEYYGAYCDALGKELTEYIATTGTINVFDSANVTMDQTQLNRTTSKAISLNVQNLDPRFNFYKIVVVEKTDVMGTTSAYIEGIHPITDTNISHTSNGDQNSQRISMNKLTLSKPVYKNFGGLVSSNGYLFGYDYEVEKEWNLQPVVNLMGTFLKWQTVEATEDLYQNGISSAKYRGYMRDEVYPFGIRFNTNTGYKTAIFPLVGRPADSEDLQPISTNQNNDVASIYNNLSQACNVSNRDRKWQFYNTAQTLGYMENDRREKITSIVTRTQVEECNQPNVKVYESGAIEMNVNNGYNNLRNWVESHREDILVAGPDSDYYSPDLVQILTDENPTECDYEDTFFFPLCENELECFDKYCDPMSPYYNQEKCESIQNTCEDGKCYGICGSVEKEPYSTVLYIDSVEGEQLVKHERLLPWEWGPVKNKYEHDTSAFAKQFSTRERVNYDTVIKDTFILAANYDEFNEQELEFEFKFDNFHVRPGGYDNNTCNESISLNARNVFFGTDSTISFHIHNKAIGQRRRNNRWEQNVKDYHNYYLLFDNAGTLTTSTEEAHMAQAPVEPLLTSTPSVAADGFEPFINKLALWYNVELEKGERKILEISPIKPSEGQADITTSDSVVRITIYDSCSRQKILFCTTYDPRHGYWKVLEREEFNTGTIYIALDTPLRLYKHDFTQFEYRQINRQAYNYFNYEYTQRMITTLSGAFHVQIREPEYYKIELSFDKLSVSKRETYTARCRYNAPKNSNCGVIPHKYGSFSYWESVEDYPDNTDLYDSRDVKIDMSRLAHENPYLRDLFEKTYVRPQGRLSSAANFACKPIRHFKFPDNVESPFMTILPTLDFKQSEIYPIGVTIDDRTVKAFLDAAVDTGLITREQRKSITGYEIFRGDRSTQRSVIMRGILNDMYEDVSKGQRTSRTFFRNFPYNTLGKNVFLSTNEDRGEYLDHPYGSAGNSRFSMISPDIYVNRPNPGMELVIDGYVYGKSNTRFVDVKKHSEWVILNGTAYKKADRYAAAEVALETALNIATQTIAGASNFWFVGGLATGTGAAGGALATAARLTFTGIQAAQNAIYKIPKLRAEWLQIFEDRGITANFAQMSVSEKGFYNYFKPNRDHGNMLRGLQTAKYLSNGMDTTYETSGSKVEVININNIDRESSLYLNTGESFPINYPATYINYDNYDISGRNSSRKKSSDNRCGEEISQGKVASPYATLKNYIPGQYGKVDEIRWVSTNNNPGFQDTKEMIFGGDAYISRVDLKNKFPLFRANAIGLANRTPYKYSRVGNVAYPTYYVDYKTSDDIFSDDYAGFVGSNYFMDCRRGSQSPYELPPSKFYLYVYGIPYFLVESEINGNYRYAGVEPHEQFASRGLNVEDWVQEYDNSIAHDNIFKYNPVYSRYQTGLHSRTLPSYYDRAKWDCLSEAENGVVWSDPDNSEVSLSDPWLVFRPFNIYRFPFNFGKLIGLNTIESTQVVGRFADNMTVFNSVDVLKDRLKPEDQEQGTGGIFAAGRPVQFSHTDLGETGSQHRAFVSTEFGHFWVDAKRGKVFQMDPNGKGLTAISDFRSGGQGESGMRRWFKRALPFKILKQDIKGMTDNDVDNPYKGLGIVMGWDSRFKRLFICKRDYIVRKNYKNKIRFAGGNFYLQDGTEINLQDNTYFKDVSWTIAYSPLYASWISYYDFHFDYFIGLNDYFKTGINYQSEGNPEPLQRKKDLTVGLWSHLLTNRAYQVFYGEFYPFEIELPVKNTFTNNVLKDVKVWAFSHRYHDNFDYAQWRKKSFNKAIIHNQTNNSGVLHLNYDDTMNKSKYPIRISGTEQGIQATHHDEHVSFNYFYNRVSNEENHAPIWYNDENEIHKTLNPGAISFNSKRVLERLRGDWFHVMLISDNTSQFKQVFKWMVSREQPY